MKTTHSRPFKIYQPDPKTGRPRHIETIQVEVFLSPDGEEILTRESAERIEQIRARHRGLLNGNDIKTLRKRLRLTQGELAGLIQCGEKSLSRWENGQGYPSRLVNTLLRALDEGFLAPASLKALQEPRRATYTLPEGALHDILLTDTPISYGRLAVTNPARSPRFDAASFANCLAVDSA